MANPMIKQLAAKAKISTQNAFMQKFLVDWIMGAHPFEIFSDDLRVAAVARTGYENNFDALRAAGEEQWAIVARALMYHLLGSEDENCPGHWAMLNSGLLTDHELNIWHSSSEITPFLHTISYTWHEDDIELWYAKDLRRFAAGEYDYGNDEDGMF